MSQEGGGERPGPGPPAPVPPNLSQFYTRADALQADLVSWLADYSKRIGVTYLPAVEPKGGQ